MYIPPCRFGKLYVCVLDSILKSLTDLSDDADTTVLLLVIAIEFTPPKINELYYWKEKQAYGCEHWQNGVLARYCTDQTL